jgi:hypothetical protein
MLKPNNAMLPFRDQAGQSPFLAQGSSNSFNRPLVPTELDRLFLELWDDDQLLFPDAVPAIDEMLFPDAVLNPEDMSYPESMPAPMDLGDSDPDESATLALPVAHDPQVRAEPRTVIRGNSDVLGDSADPTEAESARSYSQFGFMMPLYWALGVTPDWLRDRVKTAQKAWKTMARLRPSDRPRQAQREGIDS